VALADLEAATLSHTAAADHAAATLSASTGIVSLLPGTPTAEEVATAALVEQAAADRLAAAVASGEASLSTLEAAAEALTEEQAALEERTADAKETKAEYEQSKEKAQVYQESLAETRQSPMAKGSYRLTARFGMTGGYWSSGVHTGLDFAGPVGTPIMAAASGTVVSSGYEGAYGNQVIIEHGDGYQTTYSHLSGIGVSVGDTVSTGDRIGTRGSTGNSTGAHLHFEVTKDGKFVDPEGWLGW
jgi:murein DD-endopeptidase MepM/ murein hydrolase activator NlpD